MRRFLISIAALAFLEASAKDISSAELALACSALGKEYELCREGAEAWAKRTGNTVRIVSTPSSASEGLAFFQQLLAAGASDIDVLQIDVVWTGILGGHLLDLSEAAGKRADQHFPAI